MKKIICSLLIISILINFILTGLSYSADGQQDGTAFLNDAILNFSGNEPAIPSDAAVDALLNHGSVLGMVEGGASAAIASTTSMGMSVGTSAAIIVLVITYLPLIIDTVILSLQLQLSLLTLPYLINVENIIFNKISLLNINYFNTDNEYTIGTGENIEVIELQEYNQLIKQSVSKMFIICRILSLVISLLVLIYIGIRMALSNTVGEQVKYKKMFAAWIESILILFALIYLMVFLINIGEFLTNISYNLNNQIPGENFENSVLEDIVTKVTTEIGTELVFYSIIYWILVYVQFKFFFVYVKRTLMLAFLILISPFIIVTYSIDKANDGKAQGLSTWFFEFLLNVLIQPIHGFIYVVFMFTAGAISNIAPIIGIVFLLSLGTVEKMIRRMFNQTEMASLKVLKLLGKKGKKGN